MKKTTLIGLVIALLLVAGAIFVSAHLAVEDTAEIEKDSKSQACPTPQPICSPQTCDFQCGGNCGVPRCGCGK